MASINLFCTLERNTSKSLFKVSALTGIRNTRQPREPAVRMEPVSFRMDGWMLCKIKKLDYQYFLYH